MSCHEYSKWTILRNRKVEISSDQANKLALNVSRNKIIYVRKLEFVKLKLISQLILVLSKTPYMNKRYPNFDNNIDKTLIIHY